MRTPFGPISSTTGGTSGVGMQTWSAVQASCPIESGHRVGTPGPGALQAIIVSEVGSTSSQSGLHRSCRNCVGKNRTHADSDGQEFSSQPSTVQ